MVLPLISYSVAEGLGYSLPARKVSGICFVLQVIMLKSV